MDVLRLGIGTAGVEHLSDQASRICRRRGHKELMRLDPGDIQQIADHVLELCSVVQSERELLPLFGSQIAK